MSLPQPDLGVLRKAQRGDERAFSIIVRAYQIPVYNYVLRMVGDRSLAEDLTQEVFIRVYRTISNYNVEKGAFNTWLTTLTRNVRNADRGEENGNHRYPADLLFKAPP